MIILDVIELYSIIMIMTLILRINLNEGQQLHTNTMNTFNSSPCLVLLRYFDISSDFQMDSFVQKLVLNAIEYTIYRRE